MRLGSSTGGKKRPANVRRRKPQNLLEVSMRAKTVVRQRNRRIMRWSCGMVLAVATGVGVWHGARIALSRLLWDNPDYRLGHLNVTTDGILSREEIVDASGIREGENIFRLNLAQAREKLARIPQVENIEVQRVLPSTVNVRITERRPVAWLTSQFTDDPAAGAAFLIDPRGVLMVPHREASAHYRLPVIHGLATGNIQPGDTLATDEVRTALDLIRLNDGNARFQIRGLDLSRGYCIVATDRDQARATFGLEDLAGQVERLNRVLDYCDLSQREIQTVNLMVQRNMPVSFAPLDPAAKPVEPAPAPAPAKTAKITRPSAPVAEAKPAPREVRRAQPVAKSKSKPTPVPVRRAQPVHAGR
jgi:cell division septal protein FtsQ